MFHTFHTAMASVHFYLTSYADPRGYKNITMFIRGMPRGNRVAISIATGEKILPKYWDERQQRAKPHYTGSPELNAVLNKWYDDATRLCRTMTLNNVTSIAEAKRIIRAFFLGEAENSMTFMALYDQFIAVRRVDWKENTVRKFNTLRLYLQEFSQQYGKALAFEDIDKTFYDQFRAFLLQDRKLLNNTVSKTFSMLKIFLNWAAERGYNKYSHYKTFKSPTDKVDTVYLTEQELMRLYRYDLTHNFRLECVRDVFCFQCFTGQRFSDVAAFRYDDVHNGVWIVHTRKTRDIIRVPLNEFALEILDKFRQMGRLPVISAQKTNDYIKEVCRIVGITQPVTIVQHRGKERLERIEEKCCLVSTHTARRTFVTLSLEKGMRPEVVMKITGHTDLKMLQKYVKITENVATKAMQEAWKRPELRLVSNQ